MTTVKLQWLNAKLFFLKFSLITSLNDAVHYLQTPITIILNNYLNNNVSLSQVRSRHHVLCSARAKWDEMKQTESMLMNPSLVKSILERLNYQKSHWKSWTYYQQWVIYTVAVIDVLFLLDLFFIASQNYYLNNMKCLGCTSDSV